MSFLKALSLCNRVGGRGWLSGVFGVRGFSSGGRGNFDNDTPTTQLMLKNLSWNTDADDLASRLPGANDIRVIKDRDTGNSRGFAFVQFDDVDSATEAREKWTGQDIDGRTVNIVFAKPRENNNNNTPSKLLMVRSLSQDTDNESLASHFTDAYDVRVIRDRETGDSRGFAFVEYDDEDSAKQAKEKWTGKDIDGRTVNIGFAIPRERFSRGGSDQSR